MSNPLDKVALFDRLSPEARDQLADYFEQRRHKKGQILFHEADEADAFYVVLEGQVQIIKGGTGEHSKIVAILKAGDFFGEMGLVEKAPRLGSAVMLTDGTLLVMTDAHFDKMLDDHPLIGMQIRTEIMRRHGQNIRGLMES